MPQASALTPFVFRDGSKFSVHIFDVALNQISVGNGPAGQLDYTQVTCINQPSVQFATCPGIYHIQIYCDNWFWPCPLQYTLNAGGSGPCASPPPPAQSPPPAVQNPTPVQNPSSPANTQPSPSPPPPPPSPPPPVAQSADYNPADSCACYCCTGNYCSSVAVGSYNVRAELLLASMILCMTYQLL